MRGEDNPYAQYFDCSDLSDVTIQCKGMEIKAHRVILCANSEWFKNALAPGSKASEGGVLDLSVDNPEALEYVIREVYGAETDEHDNMDVAIIARKYGLLTIESTALECVEYMLGQNDYEVHYLVDLISRLKQYPDPEYFADSIYHGLGKDFVGCFERAEIREWLQNHKEVRDHYVEAHFDELLSSEHFRSLVNTKGSLSLKHLRRLSAQMSERAEGGGKRRRL